MKIFLTGSTGYIGKRILIQLLNNGHEVFCSVRDKRRFDMKYFQNFENSITILENDFTNPKTLDNIPQGIDCAYYLIHSMSSNGDFSKAEKESAENFKNKVSGTNCKQVIYLTGIVNEEHLSKHLKSRKDVEESLKSEKYALTILRAGIIIGSGSASFEIIRDLVEKLPIMVAPKWIKTKCQPISIRNVVEFLLGVMGREDCYNRHYDIAGPDILSYKNMLLAYAEERGLKRTIISLPILSPKLSSYWLFFITSTSYSLAKNLVESMSVQVIAENNDLAEKLNINLLSYKESLQIAFDKIEQNDVLSTWYDAVGDYKYSKNMYDFMQVPTKGVYTDARSLSVHNEDRVLDRVFSIGGKNGWYYANFLWLIRGRIDRLIGGVGLRRGRRNSSNISSGESLDFWRVLFSDRNEKRLLLFAEMKVPGEAWLEFKIKNGKLFQTATFRPVGLLGRIYWYSVLPFHGLIFKGMLKKIVDEK